MSESWNDWDDLDKNVESVSPERPRKKPVRFKAWEDQIIFDDWETYTDEEIAEKLNRTPKAVTRRRKNLGLLKPNGRPTKQHKVEAILENPNEYNLSKLSKDDRISFYKTKFDKNPRYPWLVKTLMPDEIEYYKQKYIETIDNLDSINMQEEDLLHNLIVKEIAIMRIQTKIKQQEELWREADEDEKPQINMGLYKDLNEAEKQFIDYHQKLKLTREQRLKTDKEEKITMTSIVRSFLDANVKKHAGDVAGYMAYSTEKCREDMTKMNLLLGD